jgi:hypothetical protein
MDDEIIAYIRGCPDGVSPEDIAGRFLKFKNPNRALAAAAVKAILRRDARVYCGGDGLWRPSALGPAAVGGDAARWASVHLVAGPQRGQIAHISLWEPLPEPKCLRSVWLADPALLSEDDRGQLCDPRDAPYDAAEAALEIISRELSGRAPVFLSQRQCSAFSFAAANSGADGVDDYYLINQLLRAAKEPEVAPLALEKAAEMFLGGFRVAESAYRRGEQFCRVAAEVIGRMKAAGIETRDALDAALHDMAGFDFSGRAFTAKMLAELPLRPGVYGFTDKSGAYIYIGKAVNLRRRVGNYFRYNDESPEKLCKLRADAHGLTAHVCGSELEALLYERRLIKKHKPRLNSQCEVSERKGNYRPLPDSVIMLPHAQDGFRMSVWVKTGQKIKLRPFEADFKEEAALLKELREYFYSGTLPASPDDFPELEIATRWVKKYRDDVPVINVSQLGGTEDIIDAMKH